MFIGENESEDVIVGEDGFEGLRERLPPLFLLPPAEIEDYKSLSKKPVNNMVNEPRNHSRHGQHRSCVGELVAGVWPNWKVLQAELTFVFWKYRTQNPCHWV